MKETFNIGDIVVNDLGQYAKIVNIKTGRYGLSGWTSRGFAEKDEVAQIFLNINGMTSANLQVVSGGSTSPKVKSEKVKAPKVAKPKAKAKVK